MSILEEKPTVVVAAEAVIAEDAARQHEELRARRNRRLRNALDDLGLLQIVGPRWCQAGDDPLTFEFGPLGPRAADHLLVALEDLRQPAVMADPGPDQLELF